MTAVTVGKFKGVEVRFRKPTSMQLAAWGRTERMLSAIGDGDGEMGDDELKKFSGLLDRLCRLVLALVETEDDKEWLDGLMVDGDLTDDDLLELVQMALGREGDGGPAKKARRTAQ